MQCGSVGKDELLEFAMLVAISLGTLSALGVACLVQGVQTPSNLLPGLLTDSLPGARDSGRPRIDW